MKSRQQYQQMKPPRETPFSLCLCPLSRTATKRRPYGLVRYHLRLRVVEMLCFVLLFFAFVTSDVMCRQASPLGNYAVKAKGQVLCFGKPHERGNISLVLKRTRKLLVSGHFYGVCT